MGSFQVGIVGGSQSGKTLYLSCLPKFFNDNQVLRQSKVSFQGGNDDSIEWLSDAIKILKQGKIYPGTTQKKELEFLLSMGKLKGQINVIERKGSDFENYKATDLPELINNLSLCNGFVIFVDPLMSLDEQSNFYRPLFQKLFITDNISLDKRFSICLTKIDDPEFWDWYQDLEKQNPSLKDYSDEKRYKIVFKAWAKKDKGDDFTTELENKFNNQVYKNFQYYLISSIGFFEDNGTKLTNLVTLLNDEGDEEPRLRNGKNYSPVNLFDPLYWAMGGKTRSYHGNHKH